MTGCDPESVPECVVGVADDWWCALVVCSHVGSLTAVVKQLAAPRQVQLNEVEHL